MINETSMAEEQESLETKRFSVNNTCKSKWFVINAAAERRQHDKAILWEGVKEWMWKFVSRLDMSIYL